MLHYGNLILLHHIVYRLRWIHLHEHPNILINHRLASMSSLMFREQKVIALASSVSYRFKLAVGNIFINISSDAWIAVKVASLHGILGN